MTVPAKYFLLSVGMVAALSACTDVKPQLPSDVVMRASESYPVKGYRLRTWRNPVSFGPYRTSHHQGSPFGRTVARTWTIPLDRVDITFGPQHYRRDFRFQLDGDGPLPMDARCLSSVHMDSYGVNGFETVTPVDAIPVVLTCGFSQRNSPPETVRLLTLRAQGVDVYGTLERVHAAGDYQVEAVRQMQGIAMRTYSPVGFYIKDGERTLAVLDMGTNPSVNLSTDMTPEERQTVAAASAALMLMSNNLLN